VEAEGKMDILDGSVIEGHVGDGQVAVDVRVGQGSLPGGIEVQHAFSGKKVMQPLDAGGGDAGRCDLQVNGFIQSHRSAPLDLFAGGRFIAAVAPGDRSQPPQ
jgi:hypothetical protein